MVKLRGKTKKRRLELAGNGLALKGREKPRYFPGQNASCQASPLELI